MTSDVLYLLRTFTPADRRRLVGAFIVQFSLAVMDLLSVAAIFPLMQIVMGTPIDEGSLGTLNHLLGDQDTNGLVLTLGALMVGAFVLKALLALAITWWSSSLVQRLQTESARRLLAVYMSESYLRHRRRNTGELLRTIGTAVTDAHVKVLGGLITALTSLSSLLLLMGMLLVVSPVPTLCAAAYFGVVTFLLQRFLAPANHRAGREAQLTSWASSHALVDAMMGFREAVLHNARTRFVDRYDALNQRTAHASMWANYLMAVPKYVLEVATMVGLTAYLSITLLTGSAAHALPALSLFVAATIKMLPLIVALTATIGMIRVGREGLRIYVEALQEAESMPSPAPPTCQAASPVRAGTIELDGVTFRYPDASDNVIEDISLVIPPGTSMALCGASGSGKTTLVDIILGLIEPTRGQVTYGGESTWHAGEAWYETVAYVPQDVYIMDGTLAENVAFGQGAKDRDDTRVLECLSRVALDTLFRSLPDGLQTRVGERGNRLSGGQRQRIGIARALYRDPGVLVLDEATSALDNETEHRITSTLASLHGHITTIVVAHRLSTVRDADKLVFLNDGRLEAVGTFAEVVERSPKFARLAALGQLDGGISTTSPG